MGRYAVAGTLLLSWCCILTHERPAYAAVGAGAKVGELAPAFATLDTNGTMRRLGEFNGRYVVLEWHNQSCPYVKKHYASGNMQKLQKEWTDKGVVWLTVISSAPGKQGFMDAKSASLEMHNQKAAPTAVLLDPTGEMGHLYGAKTTPHMFVINPAGKLLYAGAIDDKRSTDAADNASARNYVSAALSEALAGKPISTSVTQPYGCSIKYVE